MKISMILICIGLYIGGEGSCESKAQRSTPEGNLVYAESIGNSVEYQKNQELRYEVLKVSCSANENCSVIAFCNPTLFNKDDMKKIARKLSNDFKNKKVVNVHLFDVKGVAESYSKGTRSLGDLQYERRGWYLRTDDREFLLFFPDSNRKEKPISIKLNRKTD